MLRNSFTKKIFIMFVLTISFFLFSCTPLSPEEKFIPAKPFLTEDEMTNLTQLADILREMNQHFEDILKDTSLTAVTKELGPTIIDQQQFPYRSPVYISDVKPWSSWWFPKKDNFLFSDANGKYTSVLSKYDLYRKKRYEEEMLTPPTATAAEYEAKGYNPNAISWEGLCDAWSLASISKPEPKRSVTVKVKDTVITFTVSELKGLLLKTYEAADDSDFKYYGQKFTGNFDGWVQPDIFPDQFHRLVEVQLMNQRKPIIMDHDAGVEVWNNPVYKANYLMDSIPNQPNSVFVRMWLYLAGSTLSNEKDFVGTKEVVREYDYVLTGERDSNNDLKIVSGYWVKGPEGIDSRQDHPDYMFTIVNPNGVVRKSWNPEIEIDLVDELLANSY